MNGREKLETKGRFETGNKTGDLVEALACLAGGPKNTASGIDRTRNQLQLLVRGVAAICVP